MHHKNKKGLGGKTKKIFLYLSPCISVKKVGYGLGPLLPSVDVQPCVVIV